MTASMKDGRMAWLDGLRTGDVVGLYRGERWHEGLPMLRAATVKRTPSGRLFLDKGREDWAGGSRYVKGEGRLMLGPVASTVTMSAAATPDAPPAPRPMVKPGQVWKSNDGGSLFKVSEVDAAQTRAKGANPSGSRPREVAVARLLNAGRNGYRLVSDAPELQPDVPTKAPAMSERRFCDYPLGMVATCSNRVASPGERRCVEHGGMPNRAPAATSTSSSRHEAMSREVFHLLNAERLPGETDALTTLRRLVTEAEGFRGRTVSGPGGDFGGF